MIYNGSSVQLQRRHFDIFSCHLSLSIPPINIKKLHFQRVQKKNGAMKWVDLFCTNVPINLNVSNAVSEITEINENIGTK